MGEKIGLKADNGRDKGNRRKNGSIYNFSAWHKESGLPTTASIENHLDNILDNIKGCEKNIKELSKNNKVLITIAIYFNETTPNTYFSNKILNKLTKIGGDLDIDLFDMKE